MYQTWVRSLPAWGMAWQSFSESLHARMTTAAVHFTVVIYASLFNPG